MSELSGYEMPMITNTVDEYTLCLKKTSPTFLAITRESIDGFL